MTDDSIHEALAKAAQRGRRIQGGCASCDAFQTLDGDDGVFVLTVHHDDDCPELRAMRAGSN